MNAAPSIDELISRLGEVPLVDVARLNLNQCLMFSVNGMEVSG